MSPTPAGLSHEASAELDQASDVVDPSLVTPTAASPKFGFLGLSTVRKAPSVASSSSAAAHSKRPPWNHSTVPSHGGVRPAVGKRASTTHELLTPVPQLRSPGGPPLKLVGAAAVVMPTR